MAFASVAALAVIVSREREHFGDVLFILLADLLRFVVGLRVVIAVRQPEAALVRAANHLRTILLILRGTEVKERADAHALQTRDFRLKFPCAPNCVNPRNFRVERFGSRRIDLFFVHAARVKVPDFLLIRAGSRLGICRRPLQNLVQQFAISFGKLVEASPTRVRGRHRILGQPLAAGEVVKVLAGLACLVQNREFNAVSGRTGRFRAARLLPGAQDSDGSAGQENKNRDNPNLPKRRNFPQADPLHTGSDS